MLFVLSLPLTGCTAILGTSEQELVSDETGDNNPTDANTNDSSEEEPKEQEPNTNIEENPNDNENIDNPPEDNPGDNENIDNPPEDNPGDNGNSGEEGNENTGGEEIDPPSIDDDPENYELIPTFSTRMPAEFEPVKMVKVVYPNMMPLHIYKTISEDIPLLVLVNPDNRGQSRINQAKNAFSNAGIDLNNATFIDMPIDDDYVAWVRDFSPFYVFKDKSLSIVDFTYNRPARSEQNQVPKKLSTYFDISYSKMSITHTGGNLMQDGRGTAFSDDLVVQENSNNKNYVLSQMEQYTGTNSYVITIDPQGDYIAHIDCWAKIVAPDKIIVARLPKTNTRYQYYEDVANELASTKCIYGYNYRIYRVDEPGGSTVAPYTNSLIANKNVYLPLGSNSTYNQNAIKVYQDALPGYTIKGVDASDSTTGNYFLNTDALHCRTHEIPDDNMLFIDTRDVITGEVSLKEEYMVKTNVVSYANGTLDEENINIYYSINGSEYIKKSMNQYKNSTNFTYFFKNLNHGDDVKYYIVAQDSLNNKASDPTCGNKDPHHFIVI